MQGQNFYNHKTLNLNHIHKFWCGNKFRRLSGLNTKAARVRKLSLLILDCDHHEISWWHHHFGAGKTQWCISIRFCSVTINKYNSNSAWFFTKIIWQWIGNNMFLYNRIKLEWSTFGLWFLSCEIYHMTYLKLRKKWLNNGNC